MGSIPSSALLFFILALFFIFCQPDYFFTGENVVRPNKNFEAFFAGT